MMITDLASRYGASLFDTAKSEGQQEKVLLELRLIRAVFQASPEVKEFFYSQAVSAHSKQDLLDKTLMNRLSTITTNFLGVLAENNRFEHLETIVYAYEEILDESHGLTRGQVQTATSLTQDERKKVESQVEKSIGRKVILSFEEDAQLLGGMIAQVGGWTFDDSIKTHLKKLGDDLNRRAQ